ncbi:MAG: RHS repeat-associated core domain-containing protein [Chitinophagales bacterium]
MNLDYYPFGMVMPTRSFTSNDGGYRFAFQGQEKDSEISGTKGGHLAFKYRIHDARLGRFLSIDPLAADYPFYSTYAFSGNRVIDHVELEGAEPLDKDTYNKLLRDKPQGTNHIEIQTILSEEYSIGLSIPKAYTVNYTNDGRTILHQTGEIKSYLDNYPSIPIYQEFKDMTVTIDDRFSSQYYATKAAEAYNESQIAGNPIVFFGQLANETVNTTLDVGAGTYYHAIGEHRMGNIHFAGVLLPFVSGYGVKKFLSVANDYKGVAQSGFKQDFDIVNQKIMVDGGAANGTYDFVITTSNELRLGSGHYYISDMADEVVNAGKINVTDGKIDFLQGWSGHYRPSNDNLLDAANTFGGNGLMSKDVIITPAP